MIAILDVSRFFETSIKSQSTIGTKRSIKHTSRLSPLAGLKLKILEPSLQLEAMLIPSIPQVPTILLVGQGTIFPDPYLNTNLFPIEDTTVLGQTPKILQDSMHLQYKILIDAPVLENLPYNNPNYSNFIITN